MMAAGGGVVGQLRHVFQLPAGGSLHNRDTSAVGELFLANLDCRLRRSWDPTCSSHAKDDDLIQLSTCESRGVFGYLLLT